MSNHFFDSGWRRGAAVALTMALALSGLATSPGAFADGGASVPTATGALADGKRHRIEFDKYSFKIDGERLNIYSGEFHYWRLPSPEAWRDVLQKIKAAGFNAVSLYFFWGLHQSEENGEYDFSGIRDIDLLLRICEEEGLYVIARPGPYINAEVSMGGLPAYLSNVGGGSLRTLEHPEVVAAAKQWLGEFNKIARKHLLSDGSGSILLYQVENELISDSKQYGDFLRELVAKVRADGIDVPLFHNDWGYGGRFRNTEDYGTDFYASDIYPLGFNCSAVRKQLPDREATFRGFAPDSPHFIAETQGGAFTPWGAKFNTEQCAAYADEAFTRQWSVMGMANGVTAFSYYMTHGGTNWGWTGAPASGFTSYDYGAALNEARTITPKLAAQKEAGYFHRALPALAAMDPIEQPPVNELEGAAVKSYQRLAAGGDPATAPRFLAYRLSDTNATTDTSFVTSLWLDDGASSTVNYTLDDRDPRISYSGHWEDLADPTASSGTLRSATAAGASASLSFTGTGIRYISATGTDYGKVQVQIDDREPQVVSARVDSQQNKPTQLTLFEVADLDPGEHTITLTVLGESDGSGTTVSVDAFEVLGAPNPDAAQLHNDTSGFVTFSGSWQVGRNQRWTVGDIGGDETFSSVRGDSYEFSFDGVGFDLIAPFSQNHGPAEVFIDDSPTPIGRTQEQVTNGATPQQVVFSKHDLSPGEHKVRVVVTGEPFPGSTGTFVSLDAVRIYPTADSLSGSNGRKGWARIPQLADTKLRLHGRDALALAANFPIGKQQLGYITGQLFGQAQPTPEGLVQYVVSPVGDSAEAVFYSDAKPQVELPAGATERWDADRGQLLVGWRTGQQPQDIKVNAGGQSTILRAISRDYAAQVWQVYADGSPVSVEGATLVRTARLGAGKLQLTGSMDKPGELRVLSATGAQWSWNGVASTGNVPGPERLSAPELNWRTSAGAPEAQPGFDVSAWQLADATRADNNRQGPGPSAGVVLDSNHYGFYEGDVWYRASYTASGDTITLQGNGGSGVPGHGKDPAFGQVWANGKYVGAFEAKGRPVQMKLPVAAGEQVELAVLMHNLGQNLDWSDDGLSRQNRGLYDANLNAQGALKWRIQGAQGKTRPADQVRGMYNNGGLYGERAGWHLPNYPISDWAETDELTADAGGLNWYATDFDLDVPEGQDQAYQVQITPRGGIGQDKSQVTIFVNGWNTGVYIGDIGPQTNFTIPAQFLNSRGKNRLTLAVAAKEAGMGPEAVRVVPTEATTGSVIGSQLSAPTYEARELIGTLSDATAKVGQQVSAEAKLTQLAVAAGERAVIGIDWGDHGSGFGKETAHSYLAEGDYLVRAQARDEVSGQLLAQTELGTVRVSEAQNPGDPQPGYVLTGTFSPDTRELTVGQQVSVELKLTGDQLTGVEAVEFKVDWGDQPGAGSAEDRAAVAESFSHSYSAPGSYRVTASATVAGKLVASLDLGELTVRADDPAPSDSPTPAPSSSASSAPSAFPSEVPAPTPTQPAPSATADPTGNPVPTADPMPTMSPSGIPNPTAGPSGAPTGPGIPTSSPTARHPRPGLPKTGS